MSFGLPPTQIDAEVAQAKAHEVEARAERYAQLHPDDDHGTSGGKIRRAIQRVRSVIAGRGRGATG